MTVGKQTEILEQILGDDFVPIPAVYEQAQAAGMTKGEVKETKRRIGVKVIQIELDGDVMWLWYAPARVWEKYKKQYEK